MGRPVLALVVLGACCAHRSGVPLPAHERAVDRREKRHRSPDRAARSPSPASPAASTLLDGDDVYAETSPYYTDPAIVAAREKEAEEEELEYVRKRFGARRRRFPFSCSEKARTCPTGYFCVKDGADWRCLRSDPVRQMRRKAPPHSSDSPFGEPKP
jgi:hypothetical protein